MQKILRKLKRSEFFVFVIIIALSLSIQLRSGLFFTSNNIVDIIRSIIVNGIYAVIALLSFISTGPDVSFPLVAALSSYLAVQWASNVGYEGPVLVPFLLAMLAGLLMGAINGLIIAKYEFPSLIVTLATSSIFSGILFGFFEAGRMTLPGSLNRFAKAKLLEVVDARSGLGSTLPYTFLILVAVYIVAYLVLNKTTLGRGIYAVGGDQVAAERAGFNVPLIRFGVFAINGLLAGLAGMCYTVMSQRLLPVEFAGTEMIIIAAVVLGGTRLVGGVGSLTGCVLGTILLTMVTNSLILLGIPVNWQRIFIGLIIILGTAIANISGGRRKGKRGA